MILFDLNCARNSVILSVDGANPDEIEAEGESSGSNPESPQKKQRKESSGSSDLASPVTVPPQHFGVLPFTTADPTIHSRPLEVMSVLFDINERHSRILIIDI